MQTTIVSWLLAALLSWTPNQGKSDARKEFLTSVAQDIVELAYSEPVPFKGPYAHAHMALLVASVGSLESRFEKRIQEGRCKHGECDGGHAFCFMQIHPDAGIELLENRNEITPSRSSDRILGVNLLTFDQDGGQGQRTCLHVGLHMLRRALRFSGGKDIKAYTGETGEESPSSDARLGQVREWLSKHPPPVRDEDYME